MASDDYFPTNPNILYDLRQTYAVKILEPILISIELHRERNEFPQWYEKLVMSLYTNINQKLSDDEIDEYKKILQIVTDKINKNISAFNGKDKTPEKIWEIKTNLQQLEMWLKKKMEDSGLFGKGGDYDPDEI